MKIIELQASNIKRIKAVTIAPNDHVVQINGRNGSGKTSTLDCILWTLQGAGTVDLKPVRDGEEKGWFVLKIGDDEVRYIITRTFSATAGTTKLTIESPEGALYAKPQQKLSEWFGPISLDPQEFQRMNDRERLDTLRRIVKLEIDIDELDRLNAGDFERRSQINRDFHTLTGRVETYQAGIHPDMSIDYIDTSALLQQMQSAADADRIRETEKRRRVDVTRAVETAVSQIAENDHEIDVLRNRLATLEKQNAALTAQNAERQTEMQSWGPLPEAVDIGNVRHMIEEAQKTNSAISNGRSAST